jgi:ectoine hydroxylase-related dioxygenase (phytanoyl-CoA dioxygenase family)
VTQQEIARAVEHITDHGYYVLENAIEPSLCDSLLDEIHRLEEISVPRSLDNDFHGHRTTRFYDVLNLGAVWQQLPVHPAILPVVRGVLGDDCLLNTYGTSIINPGETRQRMHVDDGPFIGARNSCLRHRQPLHEGGARASIVLNTMIALCDFTDENGATRFVPDSNKRAYPKPDGNDDWYEHSRPAVMPRGSILFFEGQCFHGGGDNTSDERRYAVTVDYCAGYLRTQENFLLSIPAARVRTFDQDLQQLIGLSMSRGGLGHVYNHSPDDLMQNLAMPTATTGPEREPPY